MHLLPLNCEHKQCAVKKRSGLKEPIQFEVAIVRDSAVTRVVGIARG